MEGSLISGSLMPPFRRIKISATLSVRTPAKPMPMNDPTRAEIKHSPDWYDLKP
jgi:hypothetical protein